MVARVREHGREETGTEVFQITPNYFQHIVFDARCDLIRVYLARIMLIEFSNFYLRFCLGRYRCYVVAATGFYYLCRCFDSAAWVVFSVSRVQGLRSGSTPKALNNVSKAML